MQLFFFDLLPLNWQESIKPYWVNIKKNATIYILEDNDEICAGGISFLLIFQKWKLTEMKLIIGFLKITYTLVMFGFL